MTIRKKSVLIISIFSIIFVTLGMVFVNILSGGLNGISTPVVADTWDNHTLAPQGNGTSKTDPFLISSAEECAWLIHNLNEHSMNYYIELTQDIDLAQFLWVPIYPPEAVNNYSLAYVYFEGNNHTIYNMKIDDTNPSYEKCGFFQGYINTGKRFNGLHVTNLNFSNVNIRTSVDAGVVAGQINYSQCGIDNVNVFSGQILQTGRGKFAAGIVGVNYNDSSHEPAVITNCSNNATIRNFQWSYIAGIAGSNFGIVRNCINTGNLYANGDATGIVAYARENSIIENCFVQCVITTTQAGGGIVGSSSQGNGTVKNSGFIGQINLLDSTSTYGSGALCGYYAGKLLNCFAVADINLLSANSCPLFEYGYDQSRANAENCYAFTRKITSVGEVTEYRKYIGEDFSAFAINPYLNSGFPFPKELFSIGEFMNDDVLAYLQEYGFTN